MLAVSADCGKKYQCYDGNICESYIHNPLTPFVDTFLSGFISA